MAERSHVLQCVSSSDAFCRHNRTGAFTIHFWILFLFISNIPSAYSCAGFLLLPQPPRAHTDSARHRAGLAGHTATSDRYPLCFQHPPRWSRQELQHHHNLNTNRTARLNLPTLFLGNGFLRKPGPQTLILRSSAAHGQSSRWGTGGAELSVPSGWCSPYAMPSQKKCHYCAGEDLCPLCARQSFPWGPVSPPL